MMQQREYGYGPVWIFDVDETRVDEMIDYHENVCPHFMITIGGRPYKIETASGCSEDDALMLYMKFGIK
jgi:hypothetical protein